MSRVFRMSTLGPIAAANARKGLDELIDLSPLSEAFRARDLPLPFEGRGHVWAFKAKVPILRGSSPVTVGDLGVRVAKISGVNHVTTLHPVVALFPGDPTIPLQVGVEWAGGDGWRTSVVFGAPVLPRVSYPYADYMAAYGWEEGFNYQAEFLPMPHLEWFVEDFQAGLHPSQHRGPAGVALRRSSSSPSRPEDPPTSLDLDDGRSRPSPRPGASTRSGRVEQPAFRSEVFRAYRGGASGRVRCAACGVDDERVLEAAHVVDYGLGPERWFNGLPLCRNHHRYFDLWLLKLGPDYLWSAADGAPSLTEMGVTRPDLTHFDEDDWRPRPHIDGVRWKYERGAQSAT